MIRVANVMIGTAKSANQRSPTSAANRAATWFAFAPRTARAMIITDTWIGKTASGAFWTATMCRSAEVVYYASHSHSAACGAR